MEVVYRCCCGIDVHKKVIVACLVNGGKQELREFGTNLWQKRHWQDERAPCTELQRCKAVGRKSLQGQCWASGACDVG